MFILRLFCPEDPAAGSYCTLAVEDCGLAGGCSPHRLVKKEGGLAVIHGVSQGRCAAHPHLIAASGQRGAVRRDKVLQLHRADVFIPRPGQLDIAAGQDGLDKTGSPKEMPRPLRWPTV